MGLYQVVVTGHPAAFRGESLLSLLKLPAVLAFDTGLLQLIRLSPFHHDVSCELDHHLLFHLLYFVR